MYGFKQHIGSYNDFRFCNRLKISTLPPPKSEVLSVFVLSSLFHQLIENELCR